MIAITHGDWPDASWSLMTCASNTESGTDASEYIRVCSGGVSGKTFTVVAAVGPVEPEPEKRNHALRPPEFGIPPRFRPTKQARRRARVRIPRRRGPHVSHRRAMMNL